MTGPPVREWERVKSIGRYLAKAHGKVPVLVATEWLPGEVS